MLDVSSVRALTFDCYGTLIDWERGILAALRPMLATHGVQAEDEALLEAFAQSEAALEAGPYRPYREILAAALRDIGAGLGWTPSDEEAAAFAASVADWPAFPDAHDALTALGERFRLGVITNCDDDLFATSAARLDVPFDVVVTAQQVGAYKPRTDGFHEALRRLGLERHEVLHVAQSLFHDHVPARELGLRSVWVDRRAGRTGSGATPPATASPEFVVHDLGGLVRSLAG